MAAILNRVAVIFLWTGDFMPYETKSKWTIDELKKMNKAALLGMHKLYLAVIIAIEVFLTAGLLMSVYLMDLKLILEFVGMMLILPISLHLITNYRINKSFSTNKIIQNTETTFRFYEDRLETSNDRGTAFVKYTELYRILETKTNFYLFLAKDQAFNIIKADCSPELIAFLQSINLPQK